MIAKLKARFMRLPKPLRFLLKILGGALAICTAPVWFPAMLALYLLLMAIGWIMEIYEGA